MKRGAYSRTIAVRPSQPKSDQVREQRPPPKSKYEPRWPCHALPCNSFLPLPALLSPRHPVTLTLSDGFAFGNQPHSTNSQLFPTTRVLFKNGVIHHFAFKRSIMAWPPFAATDGDMSVHPSTWPHTCARPCNAPARVPLCTSSASWQALLQTHSDICSRLFSAASTPLLHCLLHRHQPDST